MVSLNKPLFSYNFVSEYFNWSKIKDKDNEITTGNFKTSQTSVKMWLPQVVSREYDINKNVISY